MTCIYGGNRAEARRCTAVRRAPTACAAVAPRRAPLTPVTASSAGAGPKAPLPLFEEDTGEIATLLAAYKDTDSDGRLAKSVAASVAPWSTKRKKSKAAAKAAQAEEETAPARRLISQEASDKWEEHETRFQDYLQNAESLVAADKSFLTVAWCADARTRTSSEPPGPAPASDGDDASPGSETRSGPSVAGEGEDSALGDAGVGGDQPWAPQETPEAWPTSPHAAEARTAELAPALEAAPAPAPVVTPTGPAGTACPSPAAAATAPLAVVGCPSPAGAAAVPHAIVPVPLTGAKAQEFSGDILQWLMSHAATTHLRLEALEKRVVVLEAENGTLKSLLGAHGISPAQAASAPVSTSPQEKAVAQRIAEAANEEEASAAAAAPEAARAPEAETAEVPKPGPGAAEAPEAARVAEASGAAGDPEAELDTAAETPVGDAAQEAPAGAGGKGRVSYAAAVAAAKGCASPALASGASDVPSETVAGVPPVAATTGSAAGEDPARPSTMGQASPSRPPAGSEPPAPVGRAAPAAKTARRVAKQKSAKADPSAPSAATLSKMEELFGPPSESALLFPPLAPGA